MRVCVGVMAGFLSICVSGGCEPRPSPEGGLVLDDVRVVDVATETVSERTRIFIEGSRIAAVGPTAGQGLGTDVPVFDGSGAFVVPGFWDMHVHLQPQGFEVAFPLLVAHGVLGVRDMGGDLDSLTHLRASVASGELLGPDLFVSGEIIDGPTDGWPLRRTVEDSAQAWNTVAALHDGGADFIKVHGRLSADAYAQVAAATRAAGIPFAGHVPGSVSLDLAVTAGQATVEHMTQIPSCLAGRVGIGDDGACDNPALSLAAQQMSAGGVRQVPTLVVHRNLVDLDGPAQTEDPRLRFLHPSTRDFWELQRQANGALPPRAWRSSYYEGLLAAAAYLDRSGVTTLVGTDLGFLHTYPGSTLHEELRLLVEAGLSPARALAAATIEPLKVIGADHSGRLEPGDPADLVLLGGNPLKDVTNSARIAAVVRRGILLDRAALDALISSSVISPPKGTEPTPTDTISPFAARTTVSTLVAAHAGGVGGVAVDPASGVVLVSDFRESLYRIGTSGEVRLLSNNIEGASVVAVGPDGLVYQSHFRGGRVSALGMNGEVRNVISVGRGPVGIAWDRDGTGWVSECQDNSLRALSPEGARMEAVHSPLFNCPNGLSPSGDGSIVVANYSDGRVLKVDPAGHVGPFARVPGSGNGHLAPCRDGFLITSFSGNRVFHIDTEGRVTLLAGTGNVGSRDGAALEAELVRPNGIALSGDGREAFVNESLRHLEDDPDAAESTFRLRVLHLPEGMCD